MTHWDIPHFNNAAPSRGGQRPPATFIFDDHIMSDLVQRSGKPLPSKAPRTPDLAAFRVDPRLIGRRTSRQTNLNS